MGVDIQPGQYRISDPDYAYGARLVPTTGGGWDIIDNEGNAGNVVITIQPGDVAFEYTGIIERLS